MGEKEICHVCKKVKEPYTVIMSNNIMDYITYEHAREDGPICDRCDKYFAMTSEFKDVSEEEFQNAKKAAWFARMMLKWWEKDNKMDNGESGKLFDEMKSKELNSRNWEGTAFISKWCREQLNKK